MVIDGLVDALRLSTADTLVDLGCGTGQLTLPLARRVGRAIGVDPEPDMLRHAKAAAERDSNASNVEWMLGSADEVAAICANYRGVAAITLANAIHLVDRDRLFSEARTALPRGRALAIIANGTPLWLQDTAWSRALRGFLERWLGLSLTSHCGTDDDTRTIYRTELTAAGYDVGELRVDYTATLTLDQIVGGVFSAMSDRLPAAADRDRFATELRHAMPDAAPYIEHVAVRTLIGQIR
jgi:SAM-dependent methyltransferase